MIIPANIQKCQCGHLCLMHYLEDGLMHYREDGSNDYAGCIIKECGCKKYRAATSGIVGAQREWFSSDTRRKEK